MRFAAVAEPGCKYSRGCPTGENIVLLKLALKRVPRTERWKLGRQKQIPAQTEEEVLCSKEE